MSTQFRSFGLSALFAISSAFAQQPLDPPLKNWTAPLYWSQSRAEKNVAPRTQSASPFSPPGAMTFFAMTPCRVMDTRASRGFTGAFGPPSLSAGSARDIPMLASPCNSGIPSTVGAYSLNVAVVPPGSLGYLTVWPEGLSWPGTSTLNAPSGGIVANAAIVPAGTSGDIQILASNPTDVIIDINGYYASTDNNENTALGSGALANGGGVYNTAIGFLALASDTVGGGNTAIGAQAMEYNSGGANTAVGGAALQYNSGSSNTAVGTSALELNTSGDGNTGVGDDALGNNTTGQNNTAVGGAALSSNTTASNNTALGSGALQTNTSGTGTAVGAGALFSNTIGINNTAVGYSALGRNSTGSFNIAIGDQALAANNAAQNTAVGFRAMQNTTTGNNNTAVGEAALLTNTTGASNTALGQAALFANTTGINNTALGGVALNNNITGSNNIAIGEGAAAFVGAGNSGNILIGTFGTPGDSGTIRIGGSSAFGDPAVQSAFFVAGVRGITTGQSDAVAVVIDSNGQLGTISSSRRYKEDIHDMGDASRGLMRLRPVTFRYKKPFADGSKPIQYGLIAEEVAEVYPDLVVRNADGQVETVKYQLLDPLLLNELQRQQRQIDALEEKVRALTEHLAKTESANSERR